MVAIVRRGQEVAVPTGARANAAERVLAVPCMIPRWSGPLTARRLSCLPRILSGDLLTRSSKAAAAAYGSSSLGAGLPETSSQEHAPISPARGLNQRFFSLLCAADLDKIQHELGSQLLTFLYRSPAYIVRLRHPTLSSQPPHLVAFRRIDVRGIGVSS